MHWTWYCLKNLRQARERGSQHQPTVGPEPQGRGRSRSRSEPRDTNLRRRHSRSRSRRRSHSRRHRRRRHRSFSSSSSSSSSDEETSDRHRKKKMRSSLFGWAADAVIREAIISGPAKSVAEQLENYSRDPKEAFRRLKAQPEAPEFTDDSWKAILAGSYVDLDVINAELYQRGRITAEGHWTKVWRAHTLSKTGSSSSKTTSTTMSSPLTGLHVNVSPTNEPFSTTSQSSHQSSSLSFPLEESTTRLLSLVDKGGEALAQVITRPQPKSVVIGTVENVAGKVRHAGGVANTSVATADPQITGRKTTNVPPPLLNVRRSADVAEKKGSSDSARQPRLSAGFRALSRFGQAACSSDSCIVDGSNFEAEQHVEENRILSHLPRYLRGFGWREDSNCSSVTASRTETDSPLPQPPVQGLHRDKCRQP